MPQYKVTIKRVLEAFVNAKSKEDAVRKAQEYIFKVGVKKVLAGVEVEVEHVQEK